MYRLTGMGAMNCPGDPGCPGNPVVIPDSTCTCINGVCVESGNSCDMPVSPEVAAVQQQAAIARALKHQVAATPFSVMDWINANAGIVSLAGAGLFGMMLLRGRR